ncbi:MAG TPA: hypothetical protein ENH28_01420 [Euryarchaeota archaeon]|nr:ribosomal biogenesis protein [archaeon BMS3Bbin15]HDL14810.1 hypothetical protein [Euryarchaeota archaeon]
MGLVTTSRKPSQRTRSFSRELARALEFTYFTRGKANLVYIYSLLQNNKILVVVKEKRGNPSRIDIVDMEDNLLALVLEGVILKREHKNTNYTGDEEADIASELRERLSVPECKIFQRDNSILLQGGPEFRVRKIIRRSNYFRGQRKY